MDKLWFQINKKIMNTIIRFHLIQEQTEFRFSVYTSHDLPAQKLQNISDRLYTQRNIYEILLKQTEISQPLCVYERLTPFGIMGSHFPTLFPSVP